MCFEPCKCPLLPWLAQTALPATSAELCHGWLSFRSLAAAGIAVFDLVLLGASTSMAAMEVGSMEKDIEVPWFSKSLHCSILHLLLWWLICTNVVLQT